MIRTFVLSSRKCRFFRNIVYFCLNSSNFVCITFAQYCRLTTVLVNMKYSLHVNATSRINCILYCMLPGFKFFFGLKIFKPVWFLFSLVWDYDNAFETKGYIKNWTSLKKKIFKSKGKLNQYDIYLYWHWCVSLRQQNIDPQYYELT